MVGIFNIIFLVLLALFSLPFTLGLWIPIYLFAVFFGGHQRIKKAQEKLENTLMQGESLVMQGIQKRPFALQTRRKLVGITNSRVILISRGLFGGFTMKDFQWKDLHDAKISENVLPNLCGSNLSFSAINQSISVPGVENTAAMSIYKKAQAEEQAWEEKRRIRSLEERRAASGGVIVNTGQANSDYVSGGKGSTSITEEIEKAKRLFDSGAINDVEFQEIKSKILSKSF